MAFSDSHTLGRRNCVEINPCVTASSVIAISAVGMDGLNPSFRRTSAALMECNP